MRELLRRPGAVEVLIFTAAVLAFLASAGFPFLFDDRAQIVANSRIRSWHGTLGYFVSDVWHSYDPNIVSKYYRPVFFVWFRLNYLLFHLNPAGWHITSVLLHGMVSVLAYRVAWRVIGSRASAAVAGLIFALHPIHIESVAWVSGVTDPLMALFLLASLLLFMRWLRLRQAWLLAAAAALYVPALLCKEPALMLLPVLAVLLWQQPGEAGSPRGWSSLLPFTALAVGYFGLRTWLLHSAASGVNGLTWSTVLLSLPELLIFYLRQSLVPVGLAFSYDFHPQWRPDAAFWLALLTLATVVAAFAWWCRRLRNDAPQYRCALLLGTAIWLVWLVPVMNIRLLEVGQLVHDRYLYLPVLGLAIIVGVAFQQWMEHLQRQGAARPQLLPLATAGALCLGLLVATEVQQFDCASELLLWTRAARIAPHSDLALGNLGAILCERGNVAEGLQVFERELNYNPNSWNANYNVGYALYAKHQYAAAAPYVQRALQIMPDSAQTLRLMGGIHLQLGHLDSAERYMRDALSLSPREEGFHTALGLVLMQRGDRAGAAREFIEELQMFPGDPAATKALEQARGEQASR